MNVVAIDPGPKESALILWDGEAVLSGVIRPNEQLLAEELPMLLLSKTQRPELLAIEQIRGYGMTAGNELFDSVWWTGRFYQRAQEFDVECRMIPRKTVVTHLCETAKANDAAVRAALIYRFGGPGTRKEPGVTFGIVRDLWAALAVAVCAWDCLKVEHAGRCA